MGYKIFITKDADNDLDEIISYIVNTLNNPIAAADFLNKLEDGYKSVATNPEMFAYCTDKRLRLSGYRKFFVKNYIVFYRTDKENNTVYIMRIIYAGRDYENLI